MKKIQSFLLFNLVLIFLIVFSSCSTHKQVACPPQQQNRHLAKNTYRVRTQTPKRKPSRSTKHLTANMHVKKVKTVPAAEPTISYADIDPVPSIEAPLINETPEDLIASSNSGVYLDPVDEITKVSQDNVLINATVPALELMDKKEQRQFKREFKKDLRKNLRRAQNEVSQLPAKPARGFAIAGFVTGLVSLLILPGLFGVLAVIFSSIALARLKKNPSQTGRGMAIAGLILGIAGIVWWLLVMTGVVSGIVVI